MSRSKKTMSSSLLGSMPALLLLVALSGCGNSADDDATKDGGGRDAGDSAEADAGLDAGNPDQTDAGLDAGDPDGGARDWLSIFRDRFKHIPIGTPPLIKRDCPDSGAAGHTETLRLGPRAGSE